MSYSSTQDSDSTSSDELDLFYKETEEKPAEPLETDAQLVAMMMDVATLRDEKKVLEQRLKVVNAKIKEEQSVILVTYDARGITKMHVKGAGLFYVQSSFHPFVVDKPGFIAWLDDIGEPELAPRTPNFMTLKSWWKEKMEAGAQLPPDTLAGAFNDRSIRVRKG